MRSSLFFAFLALSCASDPPPKPAAVSTVPPMAIAPLPSVAALVTDASSPPAKIDTGIVPVTRPPKIACKLTSSSYSEEIALAFAPAKPAYVELASSAKVTAEIGDGLLRPGAKVPDVFVSAELGPLVLEGTLVDGGAALVVHPARAFLATPYLAFMPKFRGHLEGSSTSSGSLRVKFDIVYKITAANPADDIVEQPCGDFSLDVVKFDAHDAWPQKRQNGEKPAQTSMKKLGIGIRNATLLDQPSGKKLVDITSDTNDTVLVMEEKLGHSLVMWQIENVSSHTIGGVILHGWVKSSELRVVTSGLLVGMGGPPGLRGTGMSMSSRKRICDKDVAIVARQVTEGHEELRVAGHVNKGTLMYMYDAKDDLIQIEVNQPGIWRKSGTTFDVRRSDIADCRTE